MTSVSQRVVVTGGAGFIGAHVCRELCDRDLDVLVLDDLSTGKLHNLTGLEVDLVEGSILDDDVLRSTCRDANCIVHLAARPSVPRSLSDPSATHEVNATGTLRVLEAARLNGAHVVLASSSSVYGANLALPKNEAMAPAPISPYAVSKLAAEGYALAFQRCFALPTLVFRFFNVFGPLQRADHDYAAVVPRFISAALEGRPLEIHGDGRQTRDFTAVATVAAVLAEAVESRIIHDGPVNLAFGTRTSVLKLVEEIESQLGRSVERLHVAPRSGDVRDSQAANELLLSLFPSVRAVQLASGLAATVEWFRSVRSMTTL